LPPRRRAPPRIARRTSLAPDYPRRTITRQRGRRCALDAESGAFGIFRAAFRAFHAHFLLELRAPNKHLHYRWETKQRRRDRKYSISGNLMLVDVTACRHWVAESACRFCQIAG